MKALTTAKISVLMWADVLAMYTIWMMMPYLTNVWKINFTHAAGILNLFYGLVLVMPLFLQCVVDTLIGHYWMLMISSFSYSLGFELLVMSIPPLSGICNEYKPKCISQGQEILFYIALSLIAFGFSGHMTSFGEFLDMQTKPSVSDFSDKEYVMYLLSIMAVFLVPIIGLVAMSCISSWIIRFMIPTACSVLATIIFSTFSHSYNKKRSTCPHGRPTVGTRGFRYFYNVYVVSAFCHMKRRLIPILVNFGVISSIGGTYFIEQANHMQINIGSINDPLPILFVSYYSGAYLAELVCKCRGSCAFVRIMISMVLATICCITAAMVEAQRSSTMSVFWLVPQFILLGCSEGIANTTSVYFFQNPFPPRFPIPDQILKFMSHVAFGIVGIGHMVGFVLAYIVCWIDKMVGEKSYFECSRDESHLDMYFWVLAILTILNLDVFMLVESWYAYKKVEELKARRNGLRLLLRN